VDIIIKDSKPKGRTRISIDKELKDVGWGSSFRDAESADKAAFLERKLKKHYGMDDSMIGAKYFNEIK
jgi:hypothetical protein